GKWRGDIPALQAFDRAVAKNDSWEPEVPATLKSEKRFRYYIDLVNKYIYFYAPVRIKSNPIQNWNFLQDSKLGISHLLSSWKLFLFYLLSTAALLHLVRVHFRLYNSVSKENISDTMTGLYNRKILTTMLESRLQRLTAQGVNVVTMALD
ncbi:diguanylate cylase, partial [Klebsiella aerogenes]